MRAAGALGAVLLLAIALAGPHLVGAPVLLVVSTLAACVAVVALAVQPWLTPRRMPAHLRVGGIIAVLVAVHVLALFLEDPDDALYSMSPDGPTRARMALIALALGGLGTVGAVMRLTVVLRGAPAGPRPRDVTRRG